MRIGMVCPYSFSVPGGVQAHVAELAAVFIDRGHHVSVIARPTVTRTYPTTSSPAARRSRSPTTARCRG